MRGLGVKAARVAIVVALFALSVATALVGLIIVFPVLGHATWHAYGAIRKRAIGADENYFSGSEYPR